MNPMDRKPLPPPNPDPLAELRARGLVRGPTIERDRRPLPKIKLRGGGSITEFIRR